jgi:Family of unknown function (DUF6221)
VSGHDELGADEVVAFVQARLEEQELLARAVYGGEDDHRHHWRVDIEGNVAPAEPRGNDYIAVGPWGTGVGDAGDHIAHHDPARALREVEAKRRIIAEHQRYDDGFEPCCGTCGVDYYGSLMGEWPCMTLLLLALPDADHPDYREQWRPANA